MFNIMASISCLPPEILLQIFKFYLQTETQCNFINHLANVCQSWQELCKNPSLWEEFDGTLPFQVLKEYCYEGILKNCKILVFSNMRNDILLAKEIKYVYENLPELKCVDFSNVKGIRSKHFLGELAFNCPKLQEIIFNNNDKFQNFKIIPKIVGFPIEECSLFKDFLRVRGTDLVSLVFSNLYLTATEDFFIKIGKSCPNLEVLKVENVEPDNVIFFPTVEMQRHCPKLKILCLGYPVIITNQAAFVTGFPNLEIFTNPTKLNFLFPRCAVEAVIFKSPKLKELNISKCVFTRSNCLHPINYSQLENLNISSGIVYDIMCFTEVMLKWSESLKVLDVSDLTDISLNEVFLSVILYGGLKNLIQLNLKQTSVTIPTVKLLIENCQQLNFLNLEFCPELEEFSCKYEDQIAIKSLYSRLIICGY